MTINMTEETIERVFIASDWKDSVCDHCADYKSVVLLADERVCRECLEKYFDESGDKIESLTRVELIKGFDRTIVVVQEPEQL